MVIQLPEKVKNIIDTLMEAGYEAYAVGGCIRDSALGLQPGDWDITTSAKPSQVKELFRKTVDTGIQHGTVTVLIGGEGFEVTTYRIDGEYEDGRHPREVLFTANLIEDLKRRDFTINAMAYNEKDGLVDAFSGMEDLERRIIRCVGDPRERFQEDALRMMRAVRFSAQLGFEIDEDTKRAISELAENLSKVSAERIQIELVKMLLSKQPEEFMTAYETGLTRVFLPEFDAMMETPQNNRHHCYNVGEHTIEAVKQSTADKVIRLTMLLHDVAKPLCKSVDKDGIYRFYEHPEMGAEMAGQILRRLKFDNDTVRRVTALIASHDERPVLKPTAVRKEIYRVGLEQYPALFEVKRADVLGKNLYKRAEKLAYIAGYQRLYEEILEKGQCLSLKELAVTGKDLIEAGIKPGKELGEILEQLLKYVLENPDKNQKEILMKQIKV